MYPISLGELMMKMYEESASDLHVVVGCAPSVRRSGQLEPLVDQVLTAEDTHQLVTSILTEDQLDALESKRQLDFAYSMIDLARFRVNICYERDALSGVFRLIPTDPPHLEETNFPDILAEVTSRPRGLVLVTGPTGSGKSTTLAAMLDFINRHRKSKIVTIEDPIEFVHERKSCLISQREIGVHAPSFAAALHSALREDPDVVLVGELRDLETMSIAVTAAEMGILVMGTLHTNGAAQTVDRMVNVFPSDKQSHVRTMLSTSLRGVVSQQLLQRADKSGRVAALEILVNTPAASNLIRQGKLDQLENTMQAGGQFGMRTMDTAIQQLLDSRQISGKEAYKKAINKGKFEDVKDSG